MIIALLVVIVLILLFGAGVLKGWLTNVVAFGCGGLLILAALLWLGSFFGENGFAYIVYGIMALIGLLAIVGVAVNAEQGLPPRNTGAISELPQTDATRIIQPAEPEERDRVWGWFADDIALRFTPEARVTATRLYDANDVMGLDRFCRSQRNAPK